MLITGCGPIGAFAVGICRAAGAAHVIATDVNETRLELARVMGAHSAVHPDAAEAAVRAASDGLGADVVLEMSGVPSAVHQAFQLARPGGRVNMLGIPSRSIDIDFATEIIFKGLTIYGVVGRRMYDTWLQMTRFLRSGAFDPTPRHHASLATRSRGRGDASHQIRRGRQSDFRGRLMNENFVRDFDAEIAKLKDERVYKQLNYLASPQGPHVTMEGRGGRDRPVVQQLSRPRERAGNCRGGYWRTARIRRRHRVRSLHLRHIHRASRTGSGHRTIRWNRCSA